MRTENVKWLKWFSLFASKKFIISKLAIVSAHRSNSKWSMNERNPAFSDITSPQRLFTTSNWFSSLQMSRCTRSICSLYNFSVGWFSCNWLICFSNWRHNQFFFFLLSSLSFLSWQTRKKKSKDKKQSMIGYVFFFRLLQQFNNTFCRVFKPFLRVRLIPTCAFFVHSSISKLFPCVPSIGAVPFWPSLNTKIETREWDKIKNNFLVNAFWFDLLEFLCVRAIHDESTVNAPRAVSVHAEAFRQFSRVSSTHFAFRRETSHNLSPFFEVVFVGGRLHFRPFDPVRIARDSPCSHWFYAERRLNYIWRKCTKILYDRSYGCLFIVATTRFDCSIERRRAFLRHMQSRRRQFRWRRENNSRSLERSFSTFRIDWMNISFCFLSLLFISQFLSNFHKTN